MGTVSMEPLATDTSGMSIALQFGIFVYVLTKQFKIVKSFYFVSLREEIAFIHIMYFTKKVKWPIELITAYKK